MQSLEVALLTIKIGNAEDDELKQALFRQRELQMLCEQDPQHMPGNLVLVHKPDVCCFAVVLNASSGSSGPHYMLQYLHEQGIDGDVEAIDMNNVNLIETSVLEGFILCSVVTDIDLRKALEVDDSQSSSSETKNTNSSKGNNSCFTTAQLESIRLRMVQSLQSIPVQQLEPGVYVTTYNNLWLHNHPMTRCIGESQSKLFSDFTNSLRQLRTITDYPALGDLLRVVELGQFDAHMLGQQRMINIIEATKDFFPQNKEELHQVLLKLTKFRHWTPKEMATAKSSIASLLQNAKDYAVEQTVDTGSEELQTFINTYCAAIKFTNAHGGPGFDFVGSPLYNILFSNGLTYGIPRSMSTLLRSSACHELRPFIDSTLHLKTSGHLHILRVDKFSHTSRHYMQLHFDEDMLWRLIIICGSDKSKLEWVGQDPGPYVGQKVTWQYDGATASLVGVANSKFHQLSGAFHNIKHQPFNLDPENGRTIVVLGVYPDPDGGVMQITPMNIRAVVERLFAFNYGV